MATSRSLPGTVESFDDHVGLGSIRDEAGRTHRFHCTAIADGSRTIEPGTAVRFVLVPGRCGEFEATAIEAG